MTQTQAYVSYSDIDKLLAAREPLFIRNRTAKPTKILVVNYPSPEGYLAFHIPRTTIPFNICDYVDPESLRASKSFRTMLNHGVVEVMDPIAARVELNDPERLKAFRASYEEANNTYRARAGEVEKARRANSSVKDEQQKQSSQGMKNIITAMDPTLAKALSFVGNDGQKPEPKLLETTTNARLAALETRVKSGTLDETTIVSELSLMLGDLSVADLTSIAASPHWPMAAQDWARDRIAFATKASASKKGA